jgi:TolB protein
MWSPDGSRIVFSRRRNGVLDLYLKLSSGAGNEDLLRESPQNKSPQSWSPDGRFLLYLSRDPQTNGDLWVLPMEGNGKPFVREHKIRRTRRPVLAGRALGGISVGRIGAERDLRAAVSGARRAMGRLD